MTELASLILTKHRAATGTAFYGDAHRCKAFIEEHGTTAIDEAYQELVNDGIVVRRGIATVGDGPVPHGVYQLTDYGKGIVPF